MNLAFAPCVDVIGTVTVTVTWAPASLDYPLMGKPKPIAEFDLDTFSERFRGESERACAVLGAALLDSRLEALYRRRLDASQYDLLGISQPLGAFSTRFKLARALGWICEDVYFDLRKIRDIRNDFAHKIDSDLSFSNSPVVDYCNELKVARTLIEAYEQVASRGHKNLSAEVIKKIVDNIFRPPRQRFQITVEILAQHLEELTATSSAYSGPDLKAQVQALVSNLDIKISATGTVAQPASAEETKPRSEP